ncbi:hypothetical protein RJ640_022514 [Escallonia rubra]|uniref:Reverse transcriptase Ty1/copia-type domain-containing protein n=1 Tax=Escallonia rubra TaxID=112253 RepID=A0AA88R1T2_9ASTE|nr:hypothetical protein RJ640_022514 [Escallonia rubra]
MAKDAETSKPKHLDPISEYYLSSQVNSCNSLTKDTLKGSDNYVAWEQSAILTLKSHNKLAFIDGRITKPDPKSEDFLAWDIVNSTLCLTFGLQTNAIKAGSVSLADGITLRHVLYVPNLAANLIYVSCLATDANCFVAFSHDICVLQDRTSKSLIGLGKMHRGVFVFQPLSTATVAAISESESYELWHRRVGNPFSQPLIHLPTVSVVSPSLKTICDVCCRAKHTRTVFPNSISRAMDIFGLIHCDIWGPYRSPRNWFAKLSTALRSYGFLQSHADHTLFTYWKGDVFLSVFMYVDDLILVGNNSTACSSFKQYLNDCFKLKDLGPLQYFLGIEAARGPRGLFFSQHKYALDILSESGLSVSNPAAFSMEQNHGLSLADGPLLSDPGPYRRLIGRLVYLTITRPDIFYVVHVLSQFMQSPRSQHWDAALWGFMVSQSRPGPRLVFAG